MFAAIHDFFNHPGLRAAFLKARVPIGLAVVVLVLWLAQARWFWPGFAVSMFGQLIQLWAFASLNKNRDLACNGPYAVVRNPMYLGRFFILFGALMLLASGALLLVYPVIYYFYMVTRVEREEARLRPALGAPYAEYCDAVGRFVPGAPFPGSTLRYWDWALLRQNNGWANLAGTLAFWVFAFVRIRLGA